MTKQDIVRDMKAFNGGSSFINVSDFCRYMGLGSREKAKAKYLAGLERIDGAGYFIPDVSQRVYERKSV